MTQNTNKKASSRSWLIAATWVTLASSVVIFLTYLIDTAGRADVDIFELIFAAEAQGVLSNLPEVVAGVLGITITVVAIIVELASNRYTPRITDLFVKSPTNLIVLSFFVTTCLMCIWVSLTGSMPGFVPRVGTIVTVCAVAICLLILLPYFAFVFEFLNPHNIVKNMGRSTLGAIHKGKRVDDELRKQTKLRAVKGVEQLADVALNAIDHKDKAICMHAVDTLGELCRNYLQFKNEMPASWFIMDSKLRENPDFVSMQDEVLDDIENSRYWFEMKILRQYQMLYGETLNRMRDINYLIAINTRKLATLAMELDDKTTKAMALKFFNTFLRATINSRDVRTAYNVLNQYRLLAESALQMGWYEEATEMAQRFKYYGQLGFGMGLPFVLETAAYDLCSLNEMAFDLNVSCRDKMLAIMLDIDKEAEENHEFEASLRGVRKAQVKLATYYLTNDAEHLAKTIFEDMRKELPARLTSIRQELASITSKDFWEISDRGVNFDYLDPSRRDKLEKFFGWFS